MPYETETARAARLAAKKARARELAERQCALDERIKAATLTTLRAQYLGNLPEVAALLGGISVRTVADIVRRPDFPKPRRISDRIKLWLTQEVLDWVNSQPADEV